MTEQEAIVNLLDEKIKKLILIHEELKMDILRMAEEHEKLLESILNDAQTKDKVQEKIDAIVKKWDSR